MSPSLQKAYLWFMRHFSRFRDAVSPSLQKAYLWFMRHFSRFIPGHAKRVRRHRERLFKLAEERMRRVLEGDEP